MDYYLIAQNFFAALSLFLLGGALFLNILWSFENAMDLFVLGKNDYAWMTLLFIPVTACVFLILAIKSVEIIALF